MYVDVCVMDHFLCALRLRFNLLILFFLHFSLIVNNNRGDPSPHTYTHHELKRHYQDRIWNIITVSFLAV